MENPFATLIDTEALEWLETPGGNALKVLWVSAETGVWSALIRARARSTRRTPTSGRRTST